MKVEPGVKDFILEWQLGEPTETTLKRTGQRLPGVPYHSAYFLEEAINAGLNQSEGMYDIPPGS